MHAGSLVLNHRLARSAIFYRHRATKEGFDFVCVASDRPRERRKGNSIILYFRPSDGSNPRTRILPHVRFKGFMSCQRPNDGSKTAIGSFKSHLRQCGAPPCISRTIPYPPTVENFGSCTFGQRMVQTSGSAF